MNPLFPNPYCSSCFEDLHEGHIGWDICAHCAKMEKMMSERDGEKEYRPVAGVELDSGKAWDACPCYHT